MYLIFFCDIMITQKYFRELSMRKLITFILIISSLLTANTVSLAKNNQTETNTFEYINIPFWNKYNDEILIGHLETLYKNNFDIKIAAYQIEESDKIIKLALSNELPHIALDGYIGRTLTSSDERFGDIKIPDYSQYHYLLPLTLNYEADIFGKNRLRTKSMKKQFEMQKEDERSIYISLTSNFAINYYNLIKTDKIIELQEKLIQTQEQLCKYTEQRFQNGLATQNDILQEQKRLTFYLEEKNNLEEKRDVLINQLCVFLADRSFEEIQRLDFDSINTKIKTPNEIDISIVDERPDVKKAKLKLEKAGYDIRISKKNILPSFIISGTLGYNAYQLGHLFGADTGIASIGIIPYFDIFDGGRKVNTMKLMKSRYNKAFEEYNKNILTSMQEINDTLYSNKNANKNYIISERRTDIEEQDFKLIKRKEAVGTINVIDSLKKEQELYLTKQYNVSSKINTIITSINLYKAAGGNDVFKTEDL